MWPVVLKQVWRHRTRSLLTVSGVAVAMFLFVAVQALQEGVHEATAHRCSLHRDSSSGVSGGRRLTAEAQVRLPRQTLGTGVAGKETARGIS
jgi:hypothetical protein